MARATTTRLHDRILRRIYIAINLSNIGTIIVNRGRLCIHDLRTSSISLSSFKVLALSSAIWDDILLPSTGSLHDDTTHWLVRLLSHPNWCSCLTLTKIRVLVVLESLILAGHLILHRSWELITSISSLDERLNHLLILHLALHLILLNDLSRDLLLGIGCASVGGTLCI